MPFYRLLQNIWVDDQTYRRRGSIERLNMSAEKTQKLIDVGAIAPLRTPELEILSDWSERAVILKRHHIITVEDLFEALDNDPGKVAGWFKMKADDVIHWKKELEDKYLRVER